MAPAPITEDFYFILEVEQTAPIEVIVRSYKRLAFKLHPDRNSQHDATEAFQLLGRAYETLKDEPSRRSYDIIYPSIARRSASSSQSKNEHASAPRPSPRGPPPPSSVDENAQIAALKKSKQERASRWWLKRTAFDDSISKIREDIRVLQQDITNIDAATKKAVSEEIQRNSWSAWILSSIYKTPALTEDDKIKKDIERQERMISRDLKERRLQARYNALKEEQERMRMARVETANAEICDDGKIAVLEGKIRMRQQVEREAREKLEREKRAKQQREWEAKERAEREQTEKIWREQREKKERQAAEALREMMARREAEAKLFQEYRRQAEEDAERDRKMRDEERRRMFSSDPTPNHDTSQHATTRVPQTGKANKTQKAPKGQNTHNISSTSSTKPRPKTSSPSLTAAGTCRHDGWWPKLEGYRACERCHTSYGYLLQCPACNMKACASCQQLLKPTRSGGRKPTGTRQARPKQRERPPSPDYHDYY